jgi:hypothetical protein
VCNCGTVLGRIDPNAEWKGNETKSFAISLPEFHAEVESEPHVPGGCDLPVFGVDFA